MGHRTQQRVTSLLRCVGLLLFYSLLAFWSTWPLVRDATARIPVGTSGASPTTTVPMFNVWTLWWNSDRALQGFEGYWDAPIFYPTPDAFAFSEPQPMTLTVAPLIWFSDSRALAYNSYLWGSLILNGLMTFRLLREIRLGRFSSVIGGATMILLPIVHWQSDVLQLMPLWGILWMWTAFLGIARKPSVRQGAELGIAFAAALYCSVHHALFAVVLLAGCIWIVLDRWRERRLWIALLSAAVIGAGLTAPIVLPLHRVMARHEFQRTDKQLGDLAAEPRNYLAPHGRVGYGWENLADHGRWKLGVGTSVSLLALVGIVFGIRRRPWRRRTLFFATVALLSFLFSLGLDLRLGQWQPWRTLCDVVPGLSQVRNVFRFAYFVQMALVLLAAQGLYSLRIWKTACIGRTRGRKLFLSAYALAGLFVLFEVRPHPLMLAELPDARQHSDWIEFVREQTPPGSGIACVPFAPGNQAQDFEPTVRWMYLGTYHRVPLVNGYSGFFPQSYFNLRDLANRQFPDDRVFDQLSTMNVEFLVVDPGAVSAEFIGRLNHSPRLQRAFEGSSGIVVHRITKSITATTASE